jgi:hypothetical protein
MECGCGGTARIDQRKSAASASSAFHDLVLRSRPFITPKAQSYPSTTHFRFTHVETVVMLHPPAQLLEGGFGLHLDEAIKEAQALIAPKWFPLRYRLG